MKTIKKFSDPVVRRKESEPEKPVVQTKLKVSHPGDKSEQEADRVADTVMRMPEEEEQPAVNMKPEEEEESAVNMQPEQEEEKVSMQAEEEEEASDVQMKEEEEEGNIQMQEEEDDSTVAMQAEDSEEEINKAPDDEDNEVQTKPVQPSGTKAMFAPKDVSSQIAKNQSGGEPLPKKINKELSGKMGKDFSDVRIHTDTNAVQMNKDLHAKAFTHKNHVYFNQGQFAPGNSAGKRLLAHELTHTVQQSGAQQGRVQRKILVKDKPYTPTQKHKKHLLDNYGQVLVDTLIDMHNSTKEFKYASYEKLGYELRVRWFAMKSMDIANQYLNSSVLDECCNYPSAHPGGYLNTRFWEKKGRNDFIAKLTGSDKPADAVRAIFEPNAGTELECQTMTIAVEYYGLLQAIGDAEFNKKFPGGSGLVISTKSTVHGGDVVDNEFDAISITDKSELLPGDWVYFENFDDYNSLPGSSGTWTGENALVTGKDKFTGFGLSNLSENDMNKELVAALNRENSLSRTVAQLLAEGGGLQKFPVFRPQINKLMP